MRWSGPSTARAAARWVMGRERVGSDCSSVSANSPKLKTTIVDGVEVLPRVETMQYEAEGGEVNGESSEAQAMADSAEDEEDELESVKSENEDDEEAGYFGFDFRRPSSEAQVLALGVVLVTVIGLGVCPDFCVSIFWTVAKIGLFATIYFNFSWVLGKLCSFLITKFALFGYPLKFGTVTLVPWIYRKSLFLRISIQDMGFANPKGFPHKWFLRVERFSLEISLPLEEIPRILLLRKKPVPLRRPKQPDFECFAVFDVPYIEFDGISLNFELSNGRFNLNEMGREIAEREVMEMLIKEHYKAWLRKSWAAMSLSNLVIWIYEKALEKANQRPPQQKAPTTEIRELPKASSEAPPYTKSFDDPNPACLSKSGAANASGDLACEEKVVSSCDTINSPGRPKSYRSQTSKLNLKAVKSRTPRLRSLYSSPAGPPKRERAVPAQTLESFFSPPSSLDFVKRPNCLQVTVIRARDLLAKDTNVLSGTRSSDPYVVIKLREQSKKTNVCYHTLRPMYNESFSFHVSDPSTVLHVCVLDKDLLGPSELLGQWVMTLKYLVMDPTYCWGGEKISVTRKSYSDISIRGWFPLMSGKWKKLGGRGEVEMCIRWHYNPELPPVYPAPEKTALAYLEMNSKENQLRMGSMKKVRESLNRVPVLFNIHRVSIFRVEFFVQDLFRGRKGNAEKLHKKGKHCDRAEKLKIARLDFHKAFRPPKGQPGTTVYHVCHAFFVKALAPKLFDGGILGRALSQTMKGFAFNVAHKMQNVTEHAVTQKGFLMLADRKALLKGVGSGKSALNNLSLLLKSKVQGNKEDKVVTADDEDYLQPSLLEGYLEKSQVPIRMNAEVESKRVKMKNTQKCFFMLKGRTLFYDRAGDSHSRKILLDNAQLVTFDTARRLLIIRQARKLTILREPEARSTLTIKKTMSRIATGLASPREKTETREEKVAVDCEYDEELEFSQTTFPRKDRPEDTILYGWFQACKNIGVTTLVV